MTHRKRYSPSIGQATVFGEIEGLESLVQKPDIIESEGLRVIHFAISEDDRAVPGYLAEALKKARALLPEAKSSSKPPWMNAAWQAKRRKARAEYDRS